MKRHINAFERSLTKAGYVTAVVEPAAMSVVTYSPLLLVQGQMTFHMVQLENMTGSRSDVKSNSKQKNSGLKNKYTTRRDDGIELCTHQYIKVSENACVWPPFKGDDSKVSILQGSII